ncbi:MAG: hypothetical protein GX362_02400 [Methanosarcinaceae archaeon]|nr:hypothetical protein [Methanosarcinaceae archaeon]
MEKGTLSEVEKKKLLRKEFKEKLKFRLEELEKLKELGLPKEEYKREKARLTDLLKEYED